MVQELMASAYSFFSLPQRQSHSRLQDRTTWPLLLFAVLCAIVPLEIPQLMFMMVGAAVFAVLQGLHDRMRNDESSSGTQVPMSPVERRRSQARRPSQPTTSAEAASQSISIATGWDAEVNELVAQISPTPNGDRIVQHLARNVSHCLRRLVPEAEVRAYAVGDPMRGTISGVALPEVDIIVTINPEMLAANLQGRMQGRFSKSPGPGSQQLDPKKLQKSAIRGCVDRLVATGGFKFRRSAFRGSEPKVTLLAPAAPGVFNEPIPIDFSVNTTTPLYNAILLAECTSIDPRTKDLILLVKKWAKDRGVCHASKGHLSSYCWSLLTVYYLQVGAADGRPILPPFPNLDIAVSKTTAWKNGKASSQQAPVVNEGPKATVGELFKDFARFYNRTFEWRQEAISVRSGQRAPPAADFPIHTIFHYDTAKPAGTGPSIEDAFEPKHNLGECVTAASLGRLREEVARADQLCSKGATLAELLEPWVPPDRDVGEQGSPFGDEEGAGQDDDNSQRQTSSGQRIMMKPPPGLELPSKA